MSNKTQLQTNNTALNGYISRINAAKDIAASLPDAGGGGSIEMCTGTMSYDGPPTPEPTIIYCIGQNMELKTVPFTDGTFSCMKNSIIYITGWSSMSKISGGIQQIDYNMMRVAYYVNGDFSIVYAG